MFESNGEHKANLFILHEPHTPDTKFSGHFLKNNWFVGEIFGHWEKVNDGFQIDMFFKSEWKIGKILHEFH